MHRHSQERPKRAIIFKFRFHVHSNNGLKRQPNQTLDWLSLLKTFRSRPRRSFSLLLSLSESLSNCWKAFSGVYSPCVTRSLQIRFRKGNCTYVCVCVCIFFGVSRLLISNFGLVRNRFLLTGVNLGLIYLFWIVLI